MRILAVADEEARTYYDYYNRGKLDEFDLILACGDLSKNYLEFLVTMAHCPLLYVHGNHDEKFVENPPEGCICIDDRIFEYKGVRILGLGGSYRYRPGATFMYREKDMRKRIRKLWLRLKWKKGFDILLTHAPARHLNDEDAIAHRGFECFNDLMRKYHPKFFVHGHIHRNYGVHIPQRCQFEETEVINAFEYCKFDYPEPQAEENSQRL